VCADALLTTYLPSAAAVVVGADAVSAHHWTNKSGTFGLAAAAWFSGVPVYVVASRDKAEAEELGAEMRLPRLFEHTPAQLATLFLTDGGPVPPDQLAAVTQRFAADLRRLFSHF
jgi:translation initiation factor 2B subunit (eIF-2B alpha/beta/delta family)